MAHDPYKALYIHLPFCISRCAYCDFATFAKSSDDPEIDRYLEGVEDKLYSYAQAGEMDALETVYIGGGTPSHIGTERLQSLLGVLAEVIPAWPLGEVSMEANPESAEDNLLAAVSQGGVNRLSLGVQSFDDAVLKTLGRAHDAERAQKAVRLAQNYFENISIDLMCGIPGQSDESLRDSLVEAIDLKLQHISVYPLTIEEHTPFDQMLLRGEFEEVDEDTQARQMELAQTLLEQAGYSRYEVASYAQPGFACKHNIAYWSGKPYLGCGFSAATMTQNDTRRMRIQDDQICDDLNRNQMAAEDLMLGMRMTKGFSDEEMEGFAVYLPQLYETLESLLQDGLLSHE
jgi:oxygen-independent coproporphyrinogen-3 oxidase